jgi:hypothetical protein
MNARARPPRIALLWHRAEDETKARRARLDGVFRALSARAATPEPVVYSDETALAVRDRLSEMDAVLVWVNPITAGRDRSVLDGVLREAAAAGAWVSAHPDVVSALGTKEVLYRTRGLGWGSDVRVYEEVAKLREELPNRLASGPLVLKRARGNGGLGVWKIGLTHPRGVPRLSSTVRVLHAHDGSGEELTLDALAEGFAPYLEGGGRLVDQPFLPRAAEGMVRCYLSGSSVVGFAEHLTRSFGPPADPPPIGADGSRLGFDKLMHGPEVSAFRSLRDALEREWIPASCDLLGIDAASLPAIWDADFLRGSKDRSGDETWVLCEINASCVSPFPESAAEGIAQTTLDRVRIR